MARLAKAIAILSGLLQLQTSLCALNDHEASSSTQNEPFRCQQIVFKLTKILFVPAAVSCKDLCQLHVDMYMIEHAAHGEPCYFEGDICYNLAHQRQFGNEHKEVKVNEIGHFPWNAGLFRNWDDVSRSIFGLLPDQGQMTTDLDYTTRLLQLFGLIPDQETSVSSNHLGRPKKQKINHLPPIPENLAAKQCTCYMDIEYQMFLHHSSSHWFEAPETGPGSPAMCRPDIAAQRHLFQGWMAPLHLSLNPASKDHSYFVRHTFECHAYRLSSCLCRHNIHGCRLTLSPHRPGQDSSDSYSDSDSDSESNLGPVPDPCAPAESVEGPIPNMQRDVSSSSSAAPRTGFDLTCAYYDNTESSSGQSGSSSSDSSESSSSDQSESSSSDQTGSGSPDHAWPVIIGFLDYSDEDMWEEPDVNDYNEVQSKRH